MLVNVVKFMSNNCDLIDGRLMSMMEACSLNVARLINVLLLAGWG